jgi:hypothetical protein
LREPGGCRDNLGETTFGRFAAGPPWPSLIEVKGRFAAM